MYSATSRSNPEEQNKSFLYYISDCLGLAKPSLQAFYIAFLYKIDA